MPATVDILSVTCHYLHHAFLIQITLKGKFHYFSPFSGGFYILKTKIFTLMNADGLHGRVCQIIVHWVTELQEQQICPPGVVKYSCHTWCNVASLMQRDGRWNFAGMGGSTTEEPVIFNGRRSLWQFTLAMRMLKILYVLYSLKSDFTWNIIRKLNWKMRSS